MSKLYLRMPSHAIAESLQPGMPLYCEFALVANDGALEREGAAALSDMSELVKKAQRVVVLLAASDVTLLRVKVPPLSAARLKAALPNLVEDQLMTDPGECVMVANHTRDAVRTVAVVSRSWLELISRTLITLGARSMSAVPSQFCLPLRSDTVTAAVTESGADAEVAVRLTEFEGLGLSIVADQPESTAFEVLQSLVALVPNASIELSVPEPRLRDYQESLHIAPALEERIALHADSWQRWVSGADKSPVDLMSGLSASAGPQFNWRPWRWPIALGAAVIIINIIALNIEWLRLRSEAEGIRTNMIQTFRSTFPKETVVDPLAQLRQKLAASQRSSGQLAPDDFVALAAAFNEAWASTGQGLAPVAGLEYRDRTLTVRLKPGSNAPVDQLDKALATRNLSISQPNDGVLLIRSGR